MTLRLISSLAIVFLAELAECGFIIAGLFLIYGVFLIVFRPYLNNLRPILNASAVFIILTIEGVYKINQNSSDSDNMTTYILPFCILGVLLVILIANVVFMLFKLK
jgi:hypothetical protein